MSSIRLSAFVLGLLTLAACVTINITFPPAAAEQAADKIIDQVWKEHAGGATEDPAPAAEPAASPEQSWLAPVWRAAGGVLNLLVAPAHAQANFNISTPAIKALEDSMSKRHQQLVAYYDNGAIGLTNDALILLRQPGSVPLAARNKVQKWVEQENAERLALYLEVAKANGRPDWEPEIRATFARRWVEKAKVGWWYQNEKDQWLQKKPD